MKILIVEDEVLLANSLKTLLEKKASPSRSPMTARLERTMPRPASTTC